MINGKQIQNSTISKSKLNLVTPTAINDPATKQYVDTNFGYRVFVDAFGAKGDGTTNDTTAIQQAIDYAATIKAIVVFRSANYVVSSLTCGANLRLVGNNATLTQARINSTTVPILTLADNNSIKSLKLVCHPAANQSDGNGAISATLKKNILIQDCTFRNHGFFGIKVDRCKNVKIEHNDFWTDFKLDDLAVSSGKWNNSSDIYLYSSAGSTFSENIEINCNYCRSPFMSQGIWVNGQGADRRIVITNNFCVVTQEDGSEWTARSYWLETGNGFCRRHGIMSSYLTTAESGIIIIANNICSISCITGVYVSGGGIGKGVIVANNYCSHNGYTTTSDVSLSANISITGGCGLSQVSGNICADFQGTGATSGAINIQRNPSAAEAHQVRLLGNSIVGSLGNGVRILNSSDSVVISALSVVNSAAYDIYYDNNIGTSNIDNWLRISDTTIIRNNSDKSSIYIDSVSRKKIELNNVNIKGISRTLNNGNNYGIMLQNSNCTVLISNCKFSKFYANIRFIGPVSGRKTDITINGCFFDDTTIAVLANSLNKNNNFIVGTNNIYQNTTNITDWSNERAFWEGTMNSDNTIQIRDISKPTVGTWLRGDVVMNEQPNAGQAMGWVCTTGGSGAVFKAISTVEA